MKVLYAIDTINLGGATDYLFYLIKGTSEKNVSKIFCKNIYRNDWKEKNINIEKGDGRAILNQFIKENYNILHWFKSSSSNLFDELCNELDKKKIIIPIITTICQFPSKFSLELTPKELIYSQKIVFIDKFSYKNPKYNFILKSNKELIYFGTKIDYINEILYCKSDCNKESDIVVFGRASSIDKCHKEIIEWYNEIEVGLKEYVILGVEEGTNWLTEKISQYKLNDEINLYPHVDFEEFIKILSDIDIFLYQLPHNAYSSVDGTLQIAMYLRKPVVYYGPEPPKELIENGVSGFIANNKEEFILYASDLAKNLILRNNIGNKAKERIIDYYNFEETLNQYSRLYSTLLLQKLNKNKISLSYLIVHYLKLYIFVTKLCLYKSTPKIILTIYKAFKQKWIFNI